MRFMQKSVFFICLAFTCTSLAQQQQEQRDGATLGNYLKLKEFSAAGDRVSKLAIQISFNATLDAIIYTSSAHKLAAGKQYKPVFCIPTKYSLNNSDLENIVDLYIKDNNKTLSQNDRMGLVSVLALKERFPCN